MVRAEIIEVAQLEQFRVELTGYCYRMLGAASEAEDAVQETMIKALRGMSGFEGRSSLRSWLYRIASNVCIDMVRQSQRRSRPMELGISSPPEESLLGAPLAEALWITPVADRAVLPQTPDPAESASLRESVRLAFVTALQHLAPRARAILILREVLGWSAVETASLLDTTAAAVNSSLQRSRATLAGLERVRPRTPLDPDSNQLLERYVDAFQRYDIESLVKLLHTDAIQSMPPFRLWLEGSSDIATWMVQPGPSACRNSRLLATRANGCPAFGQYKRDAKGEWCPWAVQVLEISGGKIKEMAFFLDLTGDSTLFAQVGLPTRLPK